jgi:hypothetical protein
MRLARLGSALVMCAGPSYDHTQERDLFVSLVFGTACSPERTPALSGRGWRTGVVSRGTAMHEEVVLSDVLIPSPSSDSGLQMPMRP